MTLYYGYRDQHKRAPRKLWEVCDSNKWGIPPEPPVSIVEKEELVQWYIDNMRELRAAEKGV